MKSLFLAVSLLFASLGQAQEQAQRNPERYQEHFLKRMTQRLSLTEEQVAQIRTIMEEQRVVNLEKERKHFKDMTKAEREAFREERKAKILAFQQKVKPILTTEQFEQFEKVAKKMKRKRKDRKDPEKRKAHHLKKMTEHLGLNESQKSQIKSLMDAFHEKMKRQKKSLKGKKRKDLSEEEKEAFKKQFQESRAEFEASLKGILTAEQFEKFQKIKEKRKHHHKG